MSICNIIQLTLSAGSFYLELLLPMIMVVAPLEKKKHAGRDCAILSLVMWAAYLACMYLSGIMIFELQTDDAAQILDWNRLTGNTSPGSALFLMVYLGLPLAAIFLILKFGAGLRFYAALYGLSIIYLLQHIGFAVMAIIFGENTGGLLFSLLRWAVYVAVELILYFVFVRYLVREKKLPDSRSRSIVMLALTLFVAMFLNWSIRRITSSDTQRMYVMSLLYDIVCCLILLITQIQQNHEIEMRSTIEAERRLRAQMKEQYAMSRDSIEIINRKCHDLKHQISLLRGMQEGEEKEEILQDLEKNVLIYDTAVATGNEALDTILREKGLLAEKKHINWTAMADGHLLDFMKTVDIYTLFGNALDNALEASDKITQTDKRVISVTVKQQLGQVVVSVENYYNGELLRDETNETHILTTKKNKQDHGYGVGSIQEIAARYHGRVQITAQDNVFRLHVIFPNQAKG